MMSVHKTECHIKLNLKDYFPASKIKFLGYPNGCSEKEAQRLKDEWIKKLKVETPSYYNEHDVVL